MGNPPWEIQKPNSKEFFSNIDPLYRTYGKQEALEFQRRYFEADPAIEESWLAYCARLKALSNWCKYVASAFGDDEAMGSKFSLSRRKAEAEQLATEWRKQRAKRTGYSDPEHPYRYQGSADVNTYKMFAELAHALTRQGGRFGLIIPSGIYTDKGSGSLRRLFLNRCQWTHLYAFQNERFVFSNIHHSFKMVIISVNKGGHTESIATRFRLGPGDSPEAQELMTDALDDARFLSVPAEQIKRFSPNTGALLEIRTERDLKILEKMYANGVLLGDDSPQGWGIQYAREFDMTNDSKLFPPRPKWEAQGYKADEYGHWLKGEWRESGVGSRESGRGEVPSPSEKRESGVILSADGREMIRVDEVEDVALPLYQGVMIYHLSPNASTFTGGSGNKVTWQSTQTPSENIQPQFLVSNQTFKTSEKSIHQTKLVFRSLSTATNERLIVSTFLDSLPCGNSLGILYLDPRATQETAYASAVLSSLTYDWSMRQRIAGTNVNIFFLWESSFPCLYKEVLEKVSEFTFRLSLPSFRYASIWKTLKERYKIFGDLNLKQLFAVSSYERLRLRCILDAVVVELYGLNFEDFTQILQGCDYPSKQVCDKPFSRTLEPKGFWRVDKEKDPELRHTVLSLVAFHHLKHLGLDAFLNLNHGEGWMLPETLRLADYGLGHDHRAQTPQPVAARIGADTAKQWEEGSRELGVGSRDAESSTPHSPLPTPHLPHTTYRFLPWQLQGTPEDSWAECEMHAENLRQLLGKPEEGNRELGVGSRDAENPHSPLPTPHSLKPQQLNLIPPNEEQLPLF